MLTEALKQRQTGAYPVQTCSNTEVPGMLGGLRNLMREFNIVLLSHIGQSPTLAPTTQRLEKGDIAPGLPFLASMRRADG